MPLFHLPVWHFARQDGSLRIRFWKFFCKICQDFSSFSLHCTVASITNHFDQKYYRSIKSCTYESFSKMWAVEGIMSLNIARVRNCPAHPIKSACEQLPPEMVSMQRSSRFCNILIQKCFLPSNVFCLKKNTLLQKCTFHSPPIPPFLIQLNYILTQKGFFWKVTLAFSPFLHFPINKL